MEISDSVILRKLLINTCFELGFCKELALTEACLQQWFSRAATFLGRWVHIRKVIPIAGDIIFLRFMTAIIQRCFYLSDMPLSAMKYMEVFLDGQLASTSCDLNASLSCSSLHKSF
jgi:hypothetical protein